MCGFVRQPVPPAPVILPRGDVVFGPWRRLNHGVQPQEGIFDIFDDATEGPRQSRIYIRIPWRRILIISTALIALAMLLWGGTDPNPEGW